MIRLRSENAAQKAAELLKKPGAVLLVPTETVYGLVCRYGDRDAEERIYRMKHRDSAKRLGCFIRGLEQLPELRPAGQVRLLVEKYCPGPLTIVAEKSDGNTIGFRIPDHPFLQELLARTGFVLAQTSANRSGRPNVRSADEALAELCEKPDMVVDGGVIPPDAQASTVVDASGGDLRILRQGKLVIAEIASPDDAHFPCSGERAAAAPVGSTPGKK